MQTYISPAVDKARMKSQGGNNSPGPIYRQTVSHSTVPGEAKSADHECSFATAATESLWRMHMERSFRAGIDTAEMSLY